MYEFFNIFLVRLGSHNINNNNTNRSHDVNFKYFVQNSNYNDMKSKVLGCAKIHLN